jgi:sigma-B regulation protein RsbU (phosphoserine phosphatase)
MFATALYAVLDLKRSVLRLSKAGHPDALHIRRAEREFAWLRCTGEAAGPALGFFPDAAYAGAEFPLEPGDVLLLYTDGLVEVCGRGGEEFGEERLLTLANTKRSLGVPRLCDELLQNAHRFSGDGGFNDDVCLVGIEVKVTNESDLLCPGGGNE